MGYDLDPYQTFKGAGVSGFLGGLSQGISQGIGLRGQVENRKMQRERMDITKQREQRAEEEHIAEKEYQVERRNRQTKLDKRNDTKAKREEEENLRADILYKVKTIAPQMADNPDKIKEIMIENGLTDPKYQAMAIKEMNDISTKEQRDKTALANSKKQGRILDKRLGAMGEDTKKEEYRRKIAAIANHKRRVVQKIANDAEMWKINPFYKTVEGKDSPTSYEYKKPKQIFVKIYTDEKGRQRVDLDHDKVLEYIQNNAGQFRGKALEKYLNYKKDLDQININGASGRREAKKHNMDTGESEYQGQFGTDVDTQVDQVFPIYAWGNKQDILSNALKTITKDAFDGNREHFAHIIETSNVGFFDDLKFITGGGRPEDIKVFSKYIKTGDVSVLENADFTPKQIGQLLSYTQKEVKRFKQGFTEFLKGLPKEKRSIEGGLLSSGGYIDVDKQSILNEKDYHQKNRMFKYYIADLKKIGSVKYKAVLQTKEKLKKYEEEQGLDE